MNTTIIRLDCQIKAAVIGVLLSTALLVPAHADDIDVFTAGMGSAQNPNIQFVLDMSGSMGYDINGNSTGSSGLPSRASILRTAVQQLLDQNASRINAGMNVFRDRASGILWPMSDPNAYGHSIDPDIPELDNLRSKDILMNILNDQWVGSSTATVSGLTEAALYYRGETVSIGGSNTSESLHFKPNTWDTASNVYDHGRYYAANPASYTPVTAFNVGTPSGSLRYCWDYSVQGTIPSGDNQCASYTLVGSCIDYAATSGISTDGPWTSPARSRCYYNDPDSWDGAEYTSPITQSCQSNFIVLISDGDPTVGVHAGIEPIIGTSISNCENLNLSIFSPTTDTSTQGNCGPELVSTLYQNDQIPGIPDSNVTTYTIGFGVTGPGQDYLQRLANDGGGQFFSANQADALTQALDAVISDILGTTENFTELSIDVNKGTFSNDNRVFFSLFTPSGSQSWKGNLKGYFVDHQGIKDTNNVLATETDAAGTRFVETAQSFWSSTADGNDVSEGGASAKLATISRTIYSYTGGAVPALGANLNTPSGTHLLAASNANVTEAMLGVTTATERSELIDWLHAAPMGAPLHTRSNTINYPGKTVVYTMTNQGLLHAIDATHPSNPASPDHTGGEELFAFIPPELLTNLTDIKTNTSFGNHIYGLDGGMTRWHDDDNNNGIVDGFETVMLVIGMRRGGNNYYALDVTDPTNPVYKWAIHGGVAPFEKLAQSWSRMALVKVLNSGSAERVLVFGGGYDAAVLDGTTTRTAANGNSIFMVDRDGDLLWSASDVNMDFSIPADISVVDSDNNGYADRMYAADLGGQLWRVDFNDIQSGFVLHQLADLGGSSFQPFFYAPSISLSDRTASNYLSIALGSGNRTDPLDETSQNKLYMIKDKNVDAITVSTSVAIITEADLYDASNNDVGSSDATTAAAAATANDDASGWYIDLAQGEKSLSRLLTFEQNILATTFTPDSSAIAANSCTATTSIGQYYAVKSKDATPVDRLADPDGTNTDYVLTKDDRHRQISNFGIPSPPVVVFPPGADAVQIIVDKQSVQTIEQELQQVYWIPRK